MSTYTNDVAHQTPTNNEQPFSALLRGESMTQTALTRHPIELVLDLLPDAKPYSRGYLACCPGHGDRSPSLMIWEDETDNHVGLKCFTGCTRKQIVEGLKLTEHDLYF